MQNEIDYPALTASQNARLDRLEREMREALAENAELRVQEIQAEINALSEEMADTLDERREAAAIAALEATGLTTSDAQAAFDAGERVAIVENAGDEQKALQRVAVVHGRPEIVSVRKTRSRSRGADYEIVYRVPTTRIGPDARLVEVEPDGSFVQPGSEWAKALESESRIRGFAADGTLHVATDEELQAELGEELKSYEIATTDETDPWAGGDLAARIRRAQDRLVVPEWRRRELEKLERGEAAGKELSIGEELPRYADETDAEYRDRSGQNDDDYADGFRLGSGQESGTLEEMRSEWYYRGFEAGADHRAAQAKDDARDARMRAREEKEQDDAEAREEEIARTARQMGVAPDDAARIRASAAAAGVTVEIFTAAPGSLEKAVDRAIARENAAFLQDDEAQAEAARIGDLYRLVFEAEEALAQYAESGTLEDAKAAVAAKRAAEAAGWKGSFQAEGPAGERAKRALELLDGIEAENA